MPTLAYCDKVNEEETLFLGNYRIFQNENMRSENSMVHYQNLHCFPREIESRDIK